jgi:hypothetical protein
VNAVPGTCPVKVGYGNRAVADSAFEAAGFKRRVAVEITNIAEAAAYCQRTIDWGH